MNMEELQGMSPLAFAEGRHLDDDHGRYDVSRWYKNAPHEVTINFDKVSKGIYIGSVPVTKADVEKIASLGVAAILDLCGDSHGEGLHAKANGIEYLHEFVHDGYSPTQVQFDRISKWIEAHVKGGRTVYVHCHAGRGRAPTAVACYLVRFKDMETFHAVRILAEKRKHESLLVSDKQKLGLRVFENSIKKGN